MYKLAILSAVVAAVQGQYALPLGAGQPLAYNSPLALQAQPLGYNAHPIGYNPAPVAYNTAPFAYNTAQVAIPAPYAVPAPVAYPTPQAYAVPAPRDVVEAPVVSQTVEKVEQHGYSIRY